MNSAERLVLELNNPPLLMQFRRNTEDDILRRKVLTREGIELAINESEQIFKATPLKPRLLKIRNIGLRNLADPLRVVAKRRKEAAVAHEPRKLWMLFVAGIAFDDFSSHF